MRRNPDGPLVEEVRRRRHEISEEFGHDVRRYGEHLKEFQERFADRLVDQITVVARKKPLKEGGG